MCRRDIILFTGGEKTEVFATRQFRESFPEETHRKKNNLATITT